MFPTIRRTKIILDREAAVHAAFKAAREEYVNPDAPTIVLLLAKGDEELMHVGDEFVPIESDLRWPIARSMLPSLTNEP